MKNKINCNILIFILFLFNLIDGILTLLLLNNKINIDLEFNPLMHNLLINNEKNFIIYKFFISSSLILLLGFNTKHKIVQYSLFSLTLAYLLVIMMWIKLIVT